MTRSEAHAIVRVGYTCTRCGRVLGLLGNVRINHKVGCIGTLDPTDSEYVLFIEAARILYRSE